MPSLEIISVNLWQILISLCNLLILFLIIKKFLFKPVKKMLAARQDAVDRQYAEAETAKLAAEQDRAAYAEKLEGAAAEAEAVLQTAVSNANKRGEQIVAEAREKADGLLKQAGDSIELERKKAAGEIKEEIVTVSTALAEKLLEREVRAEDHRELIAAFMKEIGENHDLDS